MTLRIYGNRPLKTLPGQQTRPTPARVREALFNILQGEVAGCRWLDLCAGSGAMGAEALCRGADFVLGIERSGPACAVISHNWRQVARAGQTFEVVRGDIVKQVPRLSGLPFDYIYFDPPYASGLYETTLAAIAAHGVLKPGGALVVEHDDSTALPLEVDRRDSGQHNPNWRDPNRRQPGQGLCLSRYRQKTYGRTRLSFYAADQ